MRSSVTTTSDFVISVHILCVCISIFIRVQLQLVRVATCSIFLVIACVYPLFCCNRYHVLRYFATRWSCCVFSVGRASHGANGCLMHLPGVIVGWRKRLDLWFFFICDNISHLHSSEQRNIGKLRIMIVRAVILYMHLFELVSMVWILIPMIWMFQHAGSIHFLTRDPSLKRCLTLTLEIAWIYWRYL